jgi:hypothetical protein
LKFFFIWHTFRKYPQLFDKYLLKFKIFLDKPRPFKLAIACKIILSFNTSEEQVIYDTHKSNDR